MAVSLSRDSFAIVLAAGAATRFQAAGKAKQFVVLGTKPLYLWSVEAFALHPRIKQVVVVTQRNKIDEVKKYIVTSNLPAYVVAGGDTRQESVRLGLKAISDTAGGNSPVLVQDAARPFLTHDLINRCLDAIDTYGACAVATPVADTVKKVANNIIVGTVDRNHLALAQTPQGAYYEWLVEAHQKAFENQLATTDDAYLLEACGRQVRWILGSAKNIKITNPEDFELARFFALSFSY